MGLGWIGEVMFITFTVVFIGLLSLTVNLAVQRKFGWMWAAMLGSVIASVPFVWIVVLVYETAQILGGMGSFTSGAGR